MIESEYEKLVAANSIWWAKDGNGVPRQIRYLTDVEGLVPWTWWPHEEVGHTDEARKEIQTILDTQTVFDTPKPTRLIERIIQIATKPGDLILDSFAGSGTTAHATLHLNSEVGDSRRFIVVEVDSKIAQTVTRERIRRVAEGHTNAKDQEIPRLGGGFRYCRLGPRCFDEQGRINPEVRFADLARHVYFTETGEPLPRERVPNTPKIGVTPGGAGLYLLYNGILKDKSADGGNVLTWPVLESLPHHDGPKIIYGTACRISPARRTRENIVFKQIPYGIRTL